MVSNEKYDGLLRQYNHTSYKLSHVEADLVEAQAKVETITREAARAWRLLSKYGKHLTGCIGTEECTCGFFRYEVKDGTQL